MVPFTIRVHNELPCVGTVDLNYWGKAKDSVETVDRETCRHRNKLGLCHRSMFYSKNINKKTKNKVYMLHLQITVQSEL